MYESTRSYLSRFSGIILFVLALIIVGILVFLTARSAQDDAGITSDETTSIVSDINDSAVFGTINSENGVVTVPNSAVTQANTGANADTTLDFNGNSEALPSTGAQEVILSAVGVSLVCLGVLGLVNSRRDLSSKLLDF